MSERLMPDRIELGAMFNGPLTSATRFAGGREFINPRGLRTVLGWILPTWQRPFVWTEAQEVKFMESVWLGLPVGSYAVNMKPGSEYDGFLIDGQQRMKAIEDYLSDRFPVFGYRWSALGPVDRLSFENGRIFPYYEVRSEDEDFLRSYYDLMNFSGTPHEESQRAQQEPSE